MLRTRRSVPPPPARTPPDGRRPDRRQTSSCLSGGRGPGGVAHVPARGDRRPGPGGRRPGRAGGLGTTRASASAVQRRAGTTPRRWSPRSARRRRPSFQGPCAVARSSAVSLRRPATGMQAPTVLAPSSRCLRGAVAPSSHRRRTVRASWPHPGRILAASWPHPGLIMAASWPGDGAVQPAADGRGGASLTRPSTSPRRAPPRRQRPPTASPYSRCPA